jgi:nitrate reductase gamma subunit
MGGLIFAKFLVIALIAIPWILVSAGGEYLIGVVIPYLAFLTFVVGIVKRVVDWGRSPVPFRIPTTAGQEKSLPWIKHQKIDDPYTPGQTVVRMLLEVLCFRSLFRNTMLEYKNDADGPKIRQSAAYMLWLNSLMFHYAFLVVVLWHLRFFMDPVPYLVNIIETVDGFMEVGLPGLLLSGVILFAAAGYLLHRRIYYNQVRYISLVQDYFPLLLIITIAITGILMRYFLKVDMLAVKELTMGLVSFNPVVPQGIGALFYIHLFLVSVLLAYFPFSKLVHAPGIFMSPTRNMANNNRAVRHVNPWNYPVKVHTYAEYEDEFRELMAEAGLPLDKPLPEAPPEAEAEGGEAPSEA